MTARTGSMVIAHVLSSFGQGGQERVALELARQQRAAGHAVIAVAISSGPEGPMADAFRGAGVASDTIAKRLRIDLTLPVRLALHLRRFHVDIVHTHNPHALIYGAPAAWLAGAVAIHSKHGLNPDRKRRLWLRRAAAQLVDAYVAVTPTLAKKARERRDCASSRLHVIQNGVDVTRFAPSARARLDVRSELRIPEDAWVVATVGRLAPEKDQALLVDAMASLLDEKHQLVMVGDGPEREGIGARVSRLPCGRYIRMLGARSDVERILAACDAFALTSLTEGLPLVLLEAMATGLPVVSTAVGGVPDLIKHGQTGLLFPASNIPSLRRLLNLLAQNDALSQRLGEAGRRVVLEQYSVDRMAMQYWHLYGTSLRKNQNSGSFVEA